VRRRWLAVACVWWMACGGGGGGGDLLPDGAQDVIGDLAEDPGTPDGDAVEETIGDLAEDPGTPDGDVVEETVGDLSGDPGTADADAVEDVPLVTKHFTYRTVAGMSMGAMALTVASHHPEWFDSAGGLGGYVDFHYLFHVMRDMMGGGFCPMEQLLQPEVLADINNPDNPAVFCGNHVPLQPWEFYWDFNHFHYDNQGGNWDRDFYHDVLESLSFAYGNPLAWNPDHPLLPPGVPPEELQRSAADRCRNPVRVGKPYNYNAEYNPDGEYELVGFCDGETPVGCYQGDPNLCGKANPEYWDLVGRYDPTHAYDRPVSLVLAVDYNRNGRKDYGEPLVLNMAERWQDWGVDGCPDSREDGAGGCTVGLNPLWEEGQDPNGDNFDLLLKPYGTEGNREYDEGEPFDDFGLDGVPASRAGFADYGEGNGRFDFNPNLDAMLRADTRTFFRTAPYEVLRDHQYYFDGGIRDALHALTHMVHLGNALAARGFQVRRYMDFGGNPEALMPQYACFDVLDHLDEIDWGRKGIGDAVVMGYGDPHGKVGDASGGHVGDGCEVLLRAGILYTMAMARMPDPIWVDDYDFDGRIEFRSYYSEILGQRRWYAVNLPPGYYSPEFRDTRYPLGLILPGVGMPLKDTIGITAVMNLTWGYGRTPRFVLLAPDGQCCYRKKDTGERYCNCYKDDGGMFTCVDPQCRGEHEECQVFQIRNEGFVQECNSGHFFVNQRTNRWGEDLSVDTTNSFEDGLFEVIREAERAYRLRPEEDVLVPADFPDRLPPRQYR